MSKNETVLGLDIGSKRIGVARGNTMAKLSTPLSIVPVDGHEIEQLRQIAQTENADRLVVGLPRNLEGKDTDQTKLVRQYANDKLISLGLPIELQDEAGTSREATARMKNGSSFIHDDAHAAAIILQDYMDNL